MPREFDRVRSIWYHMWNRCYNPIDDRYEAYGGRGIRITNEWQNLEKFRAWALANGYEGHLTLERINNDCHYVATNCRWVTKQEQNRNRQGTKLNIEKAREIRNRCSSGNIRQLQHSLAREYGVSSSTIRDIHFNRKWKEL